MTTSIFLDLKFWVCVVALVLASAALVVLLRLRKKKSARHLSQPDSPKERKPLSASRARVEEKAARLEAELGFRMDDRFRTHVQLLLREVEYYKRLGLPELADQLCAVVERAVRKLDERCRRALNDVKIEGLQFQPAKGGIAPGFTLSSTTADIRLFGEFVLAVEAGLSNGKAKPRSGRYFAVRLEKDRPVRFDMAETLVSMPQTSDPITDEYGNLAAGKANQWICEITLGNRRLARCSVAWNPLLQEYEEIMGVLSAG